MTSRKFETIARRIFAVEYCLSNTHPPCIKQIAPLTDNHEFLIASKMRPFDDEARKAFYKKEIESGELYEKNGQLFMKSEASPELLQKLKDADFPENAVTVLGYAKSGSHLIMSILDAIGITRLETLLPQGKVSFIPMEFNKNTEFLEEQLTAIRGHEGQVHTTHSHLDVGNFPLRHKGKIIFIERDTPAVVVSAYHFMKKLPFLHAYLKQHDIFDDLQKFARFMFEGKHFFGMPQDYNKEWKAFAKEHPELKIEFFKFEEIIADKPKEISRMLKFLEIENADLAKIVEDSDIKKAKEHRQKEAEKTGEPFVEGIIFRKGNSKGWKEELSEETIAFYESFSN